MKILITGGAGFIGTNIALKALERGYEVAVLDNLMRSGSELNAELLKDSGASIIQWDVRFKDWPQKADAIIHLAGQPGIPQSIADPVMDFTTNAVGTLNALENARNWDCPLLFASTNKVYSEEINGAHLLEKEERYEGAPTDENFPMDSAGTHPHSPYGVSKASADLLCQEYFHAFAVPTVVFRMSCIYGLHQNGVSEQGWTDYFIRQRILGDNKLTFYGNGKQVRDCLFGDDVAEAYLMALENIDKVKGQVFNLGGGKFNSSLIEWVNILNTYTDKPPMGITYEDWRLADHKYYVSDTSKIEKALGWKAKVDIKEGIDRIVKQYAIH